MRTLQTLVWTASCLCVLINWPVDAQPNAQASANSPLTAVHLRCEYRVNPEGLDVLQPRLSWVLVSYRRGETQTAYQVQVASSPEQLARGEADLWNTGQVASGETAHIVYGGRQLHSRDEVWWKVRVWDRDGKVSLWSSPGSWTMGLLEPADWKARWVGAKEPDTATATRGPRNGYHCEIAKSAEMPKSVAIDLGQSRSFDAVRLFPARPYDWQPDTPGFLFPTQFKIEAATTPDFSDARTLLDRTASEEPNPGTNAPIYRFREVTARYVRLAVPSLPRRDESSFGFALAEMQVLSGGENVAQGAQVLAQDSIETGPWGKTNLTDGITVTIVPSAKAALPATMVRKTFAVNRQVKRALAYASALGLYELRLNGQKVGEDLLSPEWTSYRKRVQYQVYDVTRAMRIGANAVGAYLGEGWFAGRLMAVGPFPYGTNPRFLLQLELEFADGEKQTLVTDETWQCTTAGPILAAGIYDGETYDARREQTRWDSADYATAGWEPVNCSALDGRKLVWQRNEPIRVMQELTPVRLTEPKPGVFVFDLGQNMVGWCRLEAQGKGGQTVTLRHAEMLNEDGTLYTANLRGAPQVDHYTPAADGRFLYEPRFTYHGFRFVEVTGLAEAPTSTAVIGRVFHSSAPLVSRFECSDESLNHLMRNILWTQRANLMSSPNDCPQRDERFGWMGDIQSFAQTACFNMDMAAFFTKFAQDVRDDQAEDGRFSDFAPHPGDPNKSFSGAPAWADAGVLVPWRAFQNYADRQLLADQFPAAKRWVEYVRTNNPDLVWTKGRNNDYNDWLNGDWVKQSGWPAKGGSVPNELFATAFFAHSTELVSKMADLIGKPDEAREYRELHQRIKAVFNQRFVKEDGRLAGETQGGYALALNFGLLPEELRPKAAELLVENIAQYQNHLSTGIQTTHRAMLELARNGYTDTGWQLLTNRTFPSWLYMLDNGATTIWERWDGYVKGRGFQDAGMNSFNHWAFGAVGEWMWRYIVGLNPDDAHPGWSRFSVAPRPGGGVTWARGEYESMHGRIAVNWRIEQDKFHMSLTVPPNTSAKVFLPAADGQHVFESGRPAAKAEGVNWIEFRDGLATCEVSAGDYLFEAPWPGRASPGAR